jgi:hypothetical protein
VADSVVMGDPPEDQPDETGSYGGRSASGDGEHDCVAEAAGGAASGHQESFHESGGLSATGISGRRVVRSLSMGWRS